MPPRKRKAPVKSEAPAKKKVRISDVPAVIEAEESPPSRPKRKSVGTPQYNFTGPRKVPKKQADRVAHLKAESPVDPDLSAPKRRGRPPKPANPVATKLDLEPAVPASTTEAKPGRSSKNSTKKPSAKDAPTEISEDAPVEKKRGRPRKSDTATSMNQTAATTKKQQPANKTESTKPPAKAAKATSKGAKLPTKRGRGRPPKHAFTSTVVALNDPNGIDTSDADYLDQDTADEGNDEHQYWLMKAEPNDRFENGVNVKFSIDDLAAADAPEPWDGVRNYAARNNMRAMRKNDLAFFYHSNCAVPGIVGIMRIVQEHSPDKSAFDPNHPYYDPKSVPSNPRWDCVHVEFVKKFAAQIPLKALQENKAKMGGLQDMQLLRLGRLSVCGVTPEEWRVVLDMAGEDSGVGWAGGSGQLGENKVNDGYEPDTDGEVDAGPKEELNGLIANSVEDGVDVVEDGTDGPGEDNEKLENEGKKLGAV